MGNRLTHEFVQEEFAKAGYTLLSATYSSNNSLLDYVCDKGHRHKIRFHAFKDGARCAYCSGRKGAEGQCKKAFSDAGYTLLSPYLDSKKPLDFICDKGHRHKISWGAFKAGQRCGHCTGRYVHHEHVEQAFKSAGYTLLGKYTNAKDLLPFVCDQGHSHQISWNKFKSGKRCAHCAGNMKLSHTHVEKAFRDSGYSLLSRYTTAHAILDFICPKGHRHKTTWARFQQGGECAYCQGAIVTHEQVEKFFEKAGYKLASKYINCNDPIQFVCPNGHRHKISWSNFKKGQRCAFCPSENIGGFKADKPAILYYLKFIKNDKAFYKIGITNHSVEKRYSQEPRHYKILMEKHFLIGSLAKDEESKILKKYKKYRYDDTDVLMSGNSELFTKDVLNLDAKQTQSRVRQPVLS
jgi:hypothetical protein